MGLRVLLHRCAAGAVWICCPRTLLTSCCVCAWPRTVLATSPEPAHDLGLCARLLLELHALVCGSLAHRVAVKSAIVATARSHQYAIAEIHIRMPVPVLGCAVGLDGDLRLSG